MQNDLVKKIEAVLFYLAEPVSVSVLAKALEISVIEVREGLHELKLVLENRGVTLVEHQGEVTLTTAPELSPLIEKIIKEEREKDLGRAGIEALTIIAYKGFVTKKELEYIRGVNSQYALRNLLLRGLVERKSNPDDARMVGYSITADTLRFLGLDSISELPEYETMQKELVVAEDEIPVEENGD